MFNMTGGELVIIFIAALVVLGPEKLPEAARFVGRLMSQVRDVSQSFQNELRSAMDDVTEPMSKVANPSANYLDGADLPDTRDKAHSAEMAAAGGAGVAPAEQYVPSGPSTPEPVVDWANPLTRGPLQPPETRPPGSTGAAPPFASHDATPTEMPPPVADTEGGSQQAEDPRGTAEAHEAP